MSKMTDKEYFEQVKNFKNELDKVSPTFCTAKWLQSTILLYNGQTHSCHHPTRHKIPTEGLKENPKLIHNTPIKIHARKEMLEGIQTHECDYCWRIENSNSSHISDRVYKSAEPNWGLPYYQKVLDSGLGEDIEPSYLEVAFESTCNFACIYCSPEVSSRWMEDIVSHGHYKLSNPPSTIHSLDWLKTTNVIPIKKDEYNPYTEAFWKWWPEIYPSLNTFRITGGEPLLSKHTWKIFDWIKTNPNKDIEFDVNTNLNVPRKVIDKFIAEIKAIQGNIRNFKIFTSLEATGEQAEYIRYGMNYKEFMENVDYALTSLPETRIVFMTTINALSIFSFKDFLNEVLMLRKKHVKDAAFCNVGVSFNLLRWPFFLDMRILNKEKMKPYLDEIVEFMEYHSQKREGFGEAMFYAEEVDKAKRSCAYVMTPIDERDTLIADLKTFMAQYDERRKMDSKSVFPLLEDMLK